MTYFNPLIAPLAGTPQAQRTAAADKERVARAQALAKNTAAEGDRFEHQVESADALSPVGDGPSNNPRQKQSRHRQASHGSATDDASGEPHIDIKG